MATQFSEIRRVKLIDDDPMVREGYEYPVRYADLTPIQEDRPNLGTLSDYLGTAVDADAAVSDFSLSSSGYASFNGAELVAGWYRQGFPALLCTRYEKAQIELIRPHRRWIPVLLKPDELNPDSLQEGIRESLAEMSGTFRPQRRPWRAQVHFVERDPIVHGAFSVEIPSWSTADFLRIRLSDLPSQVKAAVSPGFRCFAQVNLGVEESEGLFFSDWKLG